MERPDVLELVSGTELTLNHLNDLCTVYFGECRWKEVVCNRLPNFVLVPLNICDRFGFVLFGLCHVSAEWKTLLLVLTESGRSMKTHRRALTLLRSIISYFPKAGLDGNKLKLLCFIPCGAFLFLLTFHYLMLYVYWLQNAIKTVNFYCPTKIVV